MIYFFLIFDQSSTQTFTLGSNVTLSDMIDLFTKEAAKTGNVGSFNELKKYLYRVASSPIRNVSFKFISYYSSMLVYLIMLVLYLDT